MLWFFIRSNEALGDKKSLAGPASVAYRKQNYFCLYTEKALRDSIKITRHHSSHFAEDYCVLIFLQYNAIYCKYRSCHSLIYLRPVMKNSCQQQYWTKKLWFCCHNCIAKVCPLPVKKSLCMVPHFRPCLPFPWHDLFSLKYLFPYGTFISFVYLFAFLFFLCSGLCFDRVRASEFSAEYMSSVLWKQRTDCSAECSFFVSVMHLKISNSCMGGMSKESVNPLK